MSDYCQECSEELFGKDFKELARLSTEADTAAGKSVQVLCEGCGPLWVNHLGRRVAWDTTPQPDTGG